MGQASVAPRTADCVRRQRQSRARLFAQIPTHWRACPLPAPSAMASSVARAKLEGAAVGAWWLEAVAAPSARQRQELRSGKAHRDPSLCCSAGWPSSFAAVTLGSARRLRPKSNCLDRARAALGGRRGGRRGGGPRSCRSNKPSRVRGDARRDHDHCARAAVGAHRHRSVPRPRLPRAGFPCPSPGRRPSSKGAPCRGHRSLAV